MIFKSIHLKEGFFERYINFTSGVNLIYSENNSSGKTTLVRFILYALGYNIPNTRKIKFSDCEVTLKLSCKTVGEVILSRNTDIFIEATINDIKQTFILPDQKNDLHQILFGTSNSDILGNLLGAFYLDQEKGWTLLNRGTVVGSIHFNIEELIRGLSGRDCSKLVEKENQLSRDIEKYKHMISIAKYRESVLSETGTLVVDSYEDEANTIQNQLIMQKNSLSAELKRIDRTLSDNKRFKKFVAEMKLCVESPNGLVFAVTESNIVGLTDSINCLTAKRKMVSTDLGNIMKQLERAYKEQKNEDKQLAFFEIASQIEIFDQKISNLSLNQNAINKELIRLKKERKFIQEEITKQTKINNSVASDISRIMIKYLEELGLGDKESIQAKYLFTKNLKELSGAILHKTVFAFRLAYIIAIEKTLEIKLPIILDSPSGKEVDMENISIMMNLLKRDFVDNQLVIASIFNYDFKEINRIEIKNRLIDSEINIL
ncbi:MAG: hypothetical protein R3Y53_04150 [Bacillota bacterium]